MGLRTDLLLLPGAVLLGTPMQGSLREGLGCCRQIRVGVLVVPHWACVFLAMVADFLVTVLPPVS